MVRCSFSSTLPLSRFVGDALPVAKASSWCSGIDRLWWCVAMRHCSRPLTLGNFWVILPSEGLRLRSLIVSQLCMIVFIFLILGGPQFKFFLYTFFEGKRDILLSAKLP